MQNTWFTPKLRKAIYTFGVAAGTLLVVVGVVSPETIDQSIEALGAVSALILALTNMLARINTPSEDFE